MSETERNGELEKKMEMELGGGGEEAEDNCEKQQRNV